VRNVRKGDNSWDGKSNRDADEGVLMTLCTRCETQEGPFASGQKHCDSGKEEEGSFDLEKRTNFTTFCKHKVVENNYGCWQNVVRTSERQNVSTSGRRQNVRNVRKGDNCWDGKLTRDADKGVLPTLRAGHSAAWATDTRVRFQRLGLQRRAGKRTSPKNTWQSITESRSRARGRLRADPRRQQPNGEGGGQAREALLRREEREESDDG
jgi:hypothetical protein